MCTINDEEGIFFPVFSSSCKRWSHWVNAELSQALCEHHGGTSLGEGGNSWQVRCWHLKAAWGLAVEMPIAQILLFISKHPPAGFLALDRMPRPRHSRASPLHHRTPLQGRSQARRAGRASCGNICMPLTPCPPGVDK